MSEEPAVIDIKTRKAITQVATEPETRPAQFLKTWQRFCKDTKVKSVMVITIDENDFMTYGLLMDSEYHEAIALLSLDDLKTEMRANFFEEE